MIGRRRWLVVALAAASATAASGAAQAQYVGTTPKGRITTAATACGGGATYCGPQVLDPNLDGFTSMTTAGFTLDPTFVGACTASPEHFPFGNDASGSEIPYIAVPQITHEPVNDLDTGAAGGVTDLVDSPNFQASFVYYDKGPDGLTDTADDRLLFRVRVGKDPSGAFGYSFLIDTDRRFGCTTAGVGGCTAGQVSSTPDSNFVLGNPGFEVEIILATGGSNKGVNIVAIDGTTSGTIKKTYPFANNQQVSLAATEVSCDDDAFIDFYIDFADLSVAGIGITSATPMRFIAATSSSPASALGGSASDIGGVNDADPAFANDDAAFKAAADNAPAVTFGGLGAGGGFPPTATVNWSTATQTAAEGDIVTLTVQLSAASATDVTVPFTLGGSAGAGADYNLGASSITITAGNTTASISIVVSNDALDEPDETVVITMGTPTGATAGSTSVYTLTISDDDPAPGVGLTAPTQSVVESAGTVTVTVALTAASGRTVTVPFTLGGTATSPADFTMTASPIIIAAGATTGSATITVVNDGVDESDETVTVTLGPPTNAALSGTTAQTVTIQDDDPPPVVTLAAATATVAESGGPLLVTVELSAVSQQVVTVPFSVGGTAVAPGDYALSAGSLTIPAGSTSASVTLTPVDDPIIEGDETVIVNLGAPINAGVGLIVTEVITISDNDGPMTVSLSTATQSAGEAAGTVVVTVQASGVGSRDVTIPFTLGGSASNLADYVVTASPIVIPAGSTTGTAIITLLDDTLDEADETVTISLGTPSNATLGAITGQTVTITDDDAAPVAQLSLAVQAVSEGAGSATVTATLSAASGRDITVPLSLGGTADQPADYTAASTTILIPAGATSGAVSLVINNDVVIEGPETIIVTMGVPTNASSGTPAVETITLIDDEAPVVAQLSAAAQTVAESAGAVTVTVTLSGPAAVAVAIPYTLSGTATAPADYGVAAGPLVIAAGATSGTITLNLVDDALQERDETIVVTLGAPTSGTLGAPGAQTITITDDDAAPAVAFSTAAQTVTEGGGSLALTVTLSGPSGLDVTVPITRAGSATTPADYALTPGPVVIPAGMTSATLTLTLVDDAVVEGDETVVVTLGSPLNATLGALASQIVTIVDNEGALTAFVGAATQSAAEGSGTVLVTVHLSSVSAQDVTIPFTLAGSATGATDYVVAARSITIPAGATEGSATVTLIDDALDELDETVIITLGTPTNAGLGAATMQTITILDDDPPPTVSFDAASASLAEGGGSLTATVRLSSASTLDVTVPLLLGGSATTPADYVASPTTIVILAGTTSASVTLTVIDDLLVEGAETVTLTLATPTNAAAGARGVETVTIIDDDNLVIPDAGAADADGGADADAQANDASDSGDARDADAEADADAGAGDARPDAEPRSDVRVDSDDPGAFDATSGADQRSYGLSGGGGCSIAGPQRSRAAPLLSLAALAAVSWAVRRRSSRRRRPRPRARSLAPGAILIGVAVTLTSGDARGQFQLDTYAPPPSPRDGFIVSRLRGLRAGDLGLTLHLDYANDPLVYEDPAGSASAERASVVAHELVAHLRGSYAVTAGFLVYAGLPVILAMTGRVLAGIPAADGVGVGDPILGARLRLLGGATRAPFALGVTAAASLPLARALDDSQAYTGSRGPAFMGGLLAELRLGSIDIDAQAGGRIARQATQANLDIGPRLDAALGIAVPLAVRWVSHAELYGSTSSKDTFSRAQTPIEGLIGIKHFADEGWCLGAAVGHGFTRGAGSPDVRGVLMIGYATPAYLPPPATPFEPVTVPVEPAPPPPPPAPPPPPPPPPVVETPRDRDQDGILDQDDRCPDDPEDKDGFEDADGCPDPDNDHDGIADADDECPLVAGSAADKGCPSAVHIDVAKGQIVIFKQVEFATNRDVILDSSGPLLEELGAVLVANPQLDRVRIEGHTDDRGRAARNLDLSRRRAQSVRHWLMAHGIAAERLLASGCGRAMPLGSNDTGEGRQRNRRVELRIVDAGDPRHGLREGCVEAVDRAPGRARAKPARR